MSAAGPSTGSGPHDPPSHAEGDGIIEQPKTPGGEGGSGSNNSTSDDGIIEQPRSDPGKDGIIEQPKAAEPKADAPNPLIEGLRKGRIVEYDREPGEGGEDRSLVGLVTHVYDPTARPDGKGGGRALLTIFGRQEVDKFVMTQVEAAFEEREKDDKGDWKPKPGTYHFLR